MVPHGHDAELSRVDRPLASARDGGSGVLVIRGDAGIGKSALLEYAAARAHRTPGARVLRAVGIEPEVQLPYAALHLLPRPATAHIDVLPPLQAAAIRGAFGLAPAGEHDRSWSPWQSQGIKTSLPRT